MQKAKIIIQDKNRIIEEFKGEVVKLKRQKYYLSEKVKRIVEKYDAESIIAYRNKKSSRRLRLFFNLLTGDVEANVNKIERDMLNLEKEISTINNKKNKYGICIN